jgi:hypothetical protein
MDWPHIRRGVGMLLHVIVLGYVPMPALPADGPWSASIGAITDYIFRGVSQSYGHGALQLGANY